MAYNKETVIPGDIITSAWGNHVQTQYDEVKSELATQGGDISVHKANIEGLASGKRFARLIIGTSQAGWTEDDVDYLCDGTDDQEEINDAIDALPAGGGEIVILDGTYNITARINVNKDNVKLRGNGDATVLKRMWNSSVSEGVITLDDVSGCTVADLQVDGNKAAYPSSNNSGISLDSSSDSTITGNTCNNNNTGISLDSSSTSTITGNTCNNNIAGISLVSSSDNTITGNTCNNNISGGIFLLSSSTSTITGNTCNNNNTGISLVSSSDDNVVVGNNTSGSSTGINDLGSGNVVEANKA